MAPGMSLVSVNAIIILAIDDGSRIFAKYYNAPHHATTGWSTRDQVEADKKPPSD